MDSSRIYVTGFIGSRRKQLAQELAKQYDYEYIDIDKLIEASDGRSIRKICMMDGEHGYRNKEYEVLKSLEDRSEFVAVCSDGIALDDMCADILKHGRVYIADEGTSAQKSFGSRLFQTEKYRMLFLWTGIMTGFAACTIYESIYIRTSGREIK